MTAAGGSGAAKRGGRHASSRAESGDAARRLGETGRHPQLYDRVRQARRRESSLYGARARLKKPRFGGDAARHDVKQGDWREICGYVDRPQLDFRAPRGGGAGGLRSTYARNAR